MAEQGNHGPAADGTISRDSGPIEEHASFQTRTYKKSTGCGSLFVTIGQQNEKVTFLSARLGKGGGCANAMCWALGEVAAEALRSGVDPERIVKILIGVGCSSRTQDFSSCIDAMGHALLEFLGKKSG